MGSREQDQEETCKCRVQSEEEAGTDAGRLKGRMPGIDRGWGWQKDRERKDRDGQNDRDREKD